MEAICLKRKWFFIYSLTLNCAQVVIPLRDIVSAEKERFKTHFIPRSILIRTKDDKEVFNL